MEKKKYGGLIVTVSICLVLAALIAVTGAVLSALGILIVVAEPITYAIVYGCIAVLVCALWVWFLCVSKSIAKHS